MASVFIPLPTPPPAAEPTRTCNGPCARTLPLDAEHFYPRSDGGRGGLTGRCRDCTKDAARVRDTAARERRRAERPKTKRCSGVCGRELPIDAEYFHRNRSNGDGFDGRCRDCKNADARERRNVERERASAERRAARERQAWAEAADRERREIEATAEPRDSLDRRTPEGRRNLIRLRIAVSPGDAADAAERARSLMAAGNAYVCELERPPFRADDVLLDLADAAAEDGGGSAGVSALGGALKQIGWMPEAAAR